MLIIIKQAQQVCTRRLRLTAAILFVSLLGACTHPHNVDVTIKKTPPETKSTSFTRAVYDLGLMTEIYGAEQVNVMPQSIIDNTGTSVATQAEIPRDITEMLKSTLNAIGGNVIFIPYDPDFIVASAQIGYSAFGEKLIPHVVVSGGITEFDRGLETRGKGTDLGLEGTINKKQLGLEFSSQEKQSLASITLDFNLIDFQTFAGIPRIQSVNNIKVHKGLVEDSLGISIIGNAVGLKGTVKKVQGRHASVRLLVQLSMIQLMGKYMNLPYWRLLPDMEADPLVLNAVTQEFYEMDDMQRMLKFQEYLTLSGYNLALSGVLDARTKAALSAFSQVHPESTNRIDEKTYLALFNSVPLTYETLRKRKLIESAMQLTHSGSSAISQDGQLRIWTDALNYTIGESATIHFEVSKPMYVRVVYVSADGEASDIFPNDFQQGSLMKPGTNYQIPPVERPFSLEITGPVGTDRVFVIASGHPFPDGFELVDEEGQLTQVAKEHSETNLDLAINIVE